MLICEYLSGHRRLVVVLLVTPQYEPAFPTINNLAQNGNTP